MNIILKSLELQNFKGVKALKLCFNENSNYINGANGTGKTTIADAFTWLLFNQSSQGMKDFNIKTYDQNNEIIPKLVHSVKAIIIADGLEHAIQKVHEQKWTKKRGQLQEVLEGSVNTYYINETPLKEKEFNAKIFELFQIDMFLLLSNPFAFANLHWQDRRNILFNLVDVSDKDILLSNDKLSKLQGLLKNKTISELQVEIKNKKKTIKKEYETVPSLILENQKSIVAVTKPTVDLDEIEKQISDVSIANEKANEEKLKYQEKMYTLKHKIQMMNFEATTKHKEILHEYEWRIKENDKEKKQIEKFKIAHEKQIDKLEAELVNLRKQLQDTKQLVFVLDENKLTCPTCKQTILNASQKKLELEQSFNENKATLLEDIKWNGKQKRGEQDENKRDLEICEQRLKELAELEKQTEELGKQLGKQLEAKELKELKKELEELQKIEFEATTIDSSDLQKQKKEIMQYQFQCEQNKRIEERIETLKAQEKDLAIKFAKAEQHEELVKLFIETKIRMIEEKINERFNFVSFKLFQRLVNGEIVECCEILVKGIPFALTNTASRLNAGLDVIKTLSLHYDCQVPVFIDNRESVTKVIEIDSQTINLVVSPSDTTLKLN